MKNNKTTLIQVLTVILCGAGASSASAQWQSGFVRPNNVPCPSGYNLRTYNWGGGSTNSGWSGSGNIMPGGVGIGGGYNWGQTRQQPSYSEQWCVPVPKPAPMCPYPGAQTMPRVTPIPNYGGARYGR